MHMTSRELVRRWYGQIKEQPSSVASDLRSIVAHTILPSTNRSSFGEASFAPLSGCIDVVMHTELNTADEVAAVTIRGYRASYDPDYNEMTVGGPNNFLFIKDLKQRPFRGSKARSRQIDSEHEPALLLAALEMDAEREAAMRFRPMMRYPRFAGAVLSFDNENAPSFDETDGLKRLALHQLHAHSMPHKALCAPDGYRGKVTRVIREMSCGLTAIELSDCEGFDDVELVVEVPNWGQVFVKSGQEVRGGQQLAAMTLSNKVLEPLYKANKTLDSLWNAVIANIGEQDAMMLLKTTWRSEVFKWAGMTMAPNHILSMDQAAKTMGVWRDLRGCVDRVCHSHRNPSQIIRAGRREGRISVWDIQNDPIEDALQAHMPFGPVDLFSLPDRDAKVEVIYSGDLTAVAD